MEGGEEARMAQVEWKEMCLGVRDVIVARSDGETATAETSHGANRDRLWSVCNSISYSFIYTEPGHSISGHFVFNYLSDWDRQC